LLELARRRTMKDICAEPAMPSESTVRQWMDNDIEGFAARYSTAREAGRPLRRYSKSYAPEIADTILRQLSEDSPAADRDPPYELRRNKWQCRNLLVRVF
jgi:hypothetical protein